MTVENLYGAKIAVSGGLGFIGSHFITQALQMGVKILNIDKATYAANVSIFDDAPTLNYQLNKIDICDEYEVAAAIMSFRPDYFVHFAAESHVDNSIAAPDAFISTNINGTYVLLKTLNKFLMEGKLSKKFKFIHISTDEVYGELGESGKFDLNSNYAPNSPYSASKAASDLLVRAWVQTYNFPGIITNCSNNYGPYQNKEKLIPKVIKNIIEKREVPIYGNGQNVRDWLFVGDHISALFKIINKGKVGEKYFIGGDTELSNIEIVNLIMKRMLDLGLCNSDVYEQLVFVEDRKGHDFRYAIDFKETTKKVDWKPETSFEQGITRTIEFYAHEEIQ